MTDEENIRFGLGLSKGGDFVGKVLDSFDELERIRRNERAAYIKEIERLRKELDEYKRAYIDQWANQREINQTWAVIGDYNRHHLELHEAVREYIRNREVKYEDNLHCRASNPSPEIFEHGRNVAKALGISMALGIKLVYMGIHSPHAMTGITLEDLTAESFTEEEGKTVMAAYSKWEQSDATKT